MAQVVQNQNQFAMTPVLGQVSMVPSPSIFPVRLNPSSSSVLQAGTAVKLISGTANEILVDATSGPTDGPVFGVITYNLRKSLYSAGDNAEVASGDTVIFLEANAAVTRGSLVSTVAATSGADPTVQTAVTSTDYITGQALDSAAAAGSLIRVKMKFDSPGKLIG